MKYIDSIHIDGFRGLKDFDINELKSINIIVGDNNTGKTSILEAIHILEYPGEIGNYISVLREREGTGKVSPYSIFINSINKDDTITNKKVIIKGEINNKEVGCYIDGEIANVIKSDSESREIESFEGDFSYEGKESYGINGETISSINKKIYIDEVTDKLKTSSKNSFSPIKIMRVLPFDHINKELESSVIKEGRKQEIIDVLKLFDKNIIGFEMIKEDNKIKTYIEHKDTGLLPISTYGDGLKKIFYLSSAIIKARNGIILIDEIETAIHYSALAEVFKWIIDASIKYKVQLFATTHSLEAVDALLNCANDYKGKDYLKESINVITLVKGEEFYQTKIRTLDGNSAYEARENFGLELR